ncbi:hypothetical protein [Fusobacterium pseudoperiodonticum]|uniref:hypothetical protein n=1 Tax=Fusobacterium pseudoperiodonticum TaxID=2663009 RepID=UPI000C1C3618|nr:hypothetical protein [Fusobacterium pseudoperiodonticum]ATV56965.1 hypothetical protein CTM68_04195 [Fusobacterium pseudoperiodonticum]ATV64574.1 hypothetical protein CTM78_09335 [Fusobacterium pseudoperiodonticum]
MKKLLLIFMLGISVVIFGAFKEDIVYVGFDKFSDTSKLNEVVVTRNNKTGQYSFIRVNSDHGMDMWLEQGYVAQENLGKDSAEIMIYKGKKLTQLPYQQMRKIAAEIDFFNEVTW